MGSLKSKAKCLHRGRKRDTGRDISRVMETTICFKAISSEFPNISLPNFLDFPEMFKPTRLSGVLQLLQEQTQI